MDATAVCSRLAQHAATLARDLGTDASFLCHADSAWNLLWVQSDREILFQKVRAQWFPQDFYEGYSVKRRQAPVPQTMLLNPIQLPDSFRRTVNDGVNFDNAPRRNGFDPDPVLEPRAGSFPAGHAERSPSPQSSEVSEENSSVSVRLADKTGNRLPSSHPFARNAREILDEEYGAPYFRNQIEVHAKDKELDGRFKFAWRYIIDTPWHAVDGDNARLQNGDYLRYGGINAPETYHPGFNAREGAQPFGEEAAELNNGLTKGRRVLVGYDTGRAKDKYKRALSFVWAPQNPDDPDSPLVNVQYEILRYSNQRYNGSMDDPLLKKYKIINPAKDLTYEPEKQPSKAHFLRLDLDRSEAKDYQTQTPPVTVAKLDCSGLVPEFEITRPIDIPTPFGISIQTKRFRFAETSFPPEKQAQACRLLQERMGPGKNIRMAFARYHIVEEKTLKPYTPTHTYVYAPTRDNPDVFDNLNYLLFVSGFNSQAEGMPDVVTLYKDCGEKVNEIFTREKGKGTPEAERPSKIPPELVRVPLRKLTLDTDNLAWRAAEAPLQSLQISDPDTVAAYWRFIKNSELAGSKGFQADLALLTHYAQQILIQPQDQAKLLRSLLNIREPERYADWAQKELAPLLRQALEDQKVPAPRAAWKNSSWQELLLWATAGKAGWLQNSNYFPAPSRVSELVKILSQQGIDLKDPEQFLNGLAYSQVLLKVPAFNRIPNRSLIPPSFIRNGRGALFASMEAAALHEALLDQYNLVPATLFWMAYDYRESPYLSLGESQHYIALTHQLAMEAIKDAEVQQTVLRHLKNQIDSNRLKLIRDDFAKGEPTKTYKLLSPLELYLLGRSMADDPAAEWLKATDQLRTLAGTMKARGTDMKDFQKELSAFLRLPDGNSVSLTSRIQPPDTRNEQMLRDQFQASQEVFANILVQLSLAMEKDGISTNILPQLLPKAVEHVKLATAYSRSETDVETFVQTVKKINSNRVLDWLYELEKGGVRDGEPQNLGLTRRDLSLLLAKDIRGEVPSIQSALHQPILPSLSFPAEAASALKTYKTGSFRVTGYSKETDYYGSWRSGGQIKIVVGKRGSRKKLFTAAIVRIEKKRLRELSMDDLKTEFDYVDCLSNSRWQLIGKLLWDLRKFYGEEVSEDTEGYMIVFKKVSN